MEGNQMLGGEGRKQEGFSAGRDVGIDMEGKSDWEFGAWNSGKSARIPDFEGHPSTLVGESSRRIDSDAP